MYTFIYTACVRLRLLIVSGVVCFCFRYGENLERAERIVASSSIILTQSRRLKAIFLHEANVNA